ncbi:MAG: sulfotransferase domain-containing protein [Geminicoccaceae bacterium]
MIHFFAGAHKNGSHFQFYALEEALKQRALPYRTLGLEALHAHDLNRSRALISELRGADETILLKGHWYRRREQTLLLGEETIKVYLIWRDLKDVLISSYHYQINKFGADDRGFRVFYFEDGGRELLIEQSLYRLAWSGKGAHETSYEALVDDFPSEAKRLLDYAGVDGVDLDALQRETSIGRLRETRDDKKGVFFRKGTTGQFRDFHFEPDIVVDMAKLTKLGRSALLREQRFQKAKRGIKKLVAKIGFPEPCHRAERAQRTRHAKKA